MSKFFIVIFIILLDVLHIVETLGNIFGVFLECLVLLLLKSLIDSQTTVIANVYHHIDHGNWSVVPFAFPCGPILSYLGRKGRGKDGRSNERITKGTRER